MVCYPFQCEFFIRHCDLTVLFRASGLSLYIGTIYADIFKSPLLFLVLFEKLKLSENSSLLCPLSRAVYYFVGEMLSFIHAVKLGINEQLEAGHF